MDGGNLEQAAVVRVGPVGVVVELAIMDELGVGEDFPDEEGLAPAGVSEDEVGDEAFLADVVKQADDGLAVECACLKGLEVVVEITRRRAVQGVGAACCPMPSCVWVYVWRFVAVGCTNKKARCGYSSGFRRCVAGCCYGCLVVIGGLEPPTPAL